MCIGHASKLMRLVVSSCAQPVLTLSGAMSLQICLMSLT